MSKKPQLSLLTVGVSIATLLLASTTSFAAASYKGENYKGEAPAPAPCPVEPTLKDGFYVGLQGGYDVYRIKNQINVSDAENSLSTNAKVNANGWVGGALIGFGKAYDNFYMGAEVFANASAAKASNHTLVTSANTDSLSVHSETKVKSEYGVSFLPGVKINNNSLLYVRLGYNWAKVDFDNDVTGTINHVETLSGSDANQTVHGFNYGAGMETLLSDNFSVRAEYTYTNYNKTDSNNDSSLASSNDLKIADNQFMVGLIYHFS